MHSVENLKTRHVPGWDQRNLIIYYYIKIKRSLEILSRSPFWGAGDHSDHKPWIFGLKTQLHFNPDNLNLNLNTQESIFIFLIYKLTLQHHSKPLLTTYNDTTYLPVLYQDSEILEVSVF